MNHLLKKKKASQGLRGTFERKPRLDEHTGAIREDDQTLVKFHGMYMQDDRDRREERAAKSWNVCIRYMIRLRLPGGLLTAQTGKRCIISPASIQPVL